MLLHVHAEVGNAGAGSRGGNVDDKTARQPRGQTIVKECKFTGYKSTQLGQTSLSYCILIVPHQLDQSVMNLQCRALDSFLPIAMSHVV